MSEQSKQAETTEATEKTETTEHEGPADDGFPTEDVTPEEPDPEMDVTDPFGVGEDREPLEDEKDDNEKDDNEADATEPTPTASPDDPADR